MLCLTDYCFPGYNGSGTTGGGYGQGVRPQTETEYDGKIRCTLNTHPIVILCPDHSYIQIKLQDQYLVLVPAPT